MLLKHMDNALLVFTHMGWERGDQHKCDVVTEHVDTVWPDRVDRLPVRCHRFIHPASHTGARMMLSQLSRMCS